MSVTLKGENVTMDNLTNIPKKPVPRPNPAPLISKMTVSELKHELKYSSNPSRFRSVLLEYFDRQDKLIASLTNRIELLESKTYKKSGRKRSTFFFNGQELTDDYLEYLIDYDYITIPKLEKDVGAGKNQLRNRYNKVKKRKQLEKEANKT